MTVCQYLLCLIIFIRPEQADDCMNSSDLALKERTEYETCNLFHWDEQGRREICEESTSPMQIITKGEDIATWSFFRLCIQKQILAGCGFFRLTSFTGIIICGSLHFLWVNWLKDLFARNCMVSQYLHEMSQMNYSAAFWNQAYAAVQSWIYTVVH